MAEEDALEADQDLVAAWAAGWALSRGVAPPSAAYGGLRIDVGLPDQKARYVFASASPGVREAACAIQEPNVFLKICAPSQLVEPLLSDGWSLKPVNCMMAVEDLRRPRTILPAPYRLDQEHVPGGHVASILTDDGDLAASGRVFLVGTTAVFDQIETHADHRRRGLGRTIMGALSALALQSGATKGALVATPDGRALYSMLGWRLHCLYTTAVRD